MDKIVLVHVNAKKKAYEGTGENLSSITPNISMGLLDAYLEDKGISVELISAEADNLSTEETIQKVISFNPILVGAIATGENVSASTMSMPSIIDFVKKINSVEGKSFKTFVYGGHPTVLPERTLVETQANYVILGEGYETLEKLYHYMTKGGNVGTIPGLGYLQKVGADNHIFMSMPAPELVDVDTLPRINWDKMNPAKYRAHNWHCFGDDINNRSPYGIIWTGLGCPYPCEFCCINNVFGKRIFRFRSMQNVVEEIDLLVTKYKVKHLRIMDELFIIKHPRISEFCDLMEQRNYDLNIWCYARVDSVEPNILKRLKKVGVNWIGYGFETGDNEEGLKSIDKKVKKGGNTTKEVVKMTRDANINMIGHAILGLWDDDEAAIRRNRDFLYEHQFEWNNIYPIFAYPGTPLYTQYISEGRISEPKNWESYGLYSYECNPLPTKHLTSAQVLKLRDEIFDAYYTDTKVLTILEEKFGKPTRQHVEDMVKIKLKRRIVEQSA